MSAFLSKIRLTLAACCDAVTSGDLVQDIRFGVRKIRKAPGITLIAMLTMAFGLTLNGLVFSFVNDLFLRPLPARDPDRLVVMVQKVPHNSMQLSLSYLDYQDLRRSLEGVGASQDMGKSFSDLLAYTEDAVLLSRPQEGTETTWVHFTSDNYFSLLGVQPLLGRVFAAGEGRTPGADPIIVLTNKTWRTRFGSDPSIIGQQVRINEKPLTVVGVMPPGFVGAAWGTDLAGFVPCSMLGALQPSGYGLLLGRGNLGFIVMGRLKPGAGFEQARAAATVAFDQLLKAYPDYHAPQSQAVVMKERRSRPSPMISSFVPLIVSALMALALMVLAVAVANVANLLFARAVSREKELALRGALGASRARLLRQLLVESVLLAFGSGVLGLVATIFLIPFLLVSPPGMAPTLDTGVDWRMILFVIGASLATGIFSGLLPAYRATRLAILPQLKESQGATTQMRHPMRSLMVIAQVAISCVLLICAGLAATSLRKMSRVKLAFQPDHLLLASFDLGLQRMNSPQGRLFQAQLLEKVRALPGVQEASLTDQGPFDEHGVSHGGIRAEGQAPTIENAQELIPCPVIEHTYFKTMGIPVLEGRGFSTQDTASSPGVVIINKSLSKRLWPQENPVGKRLAIHTSVFEIVGMVGEGCYKSVTNPRQALVFMPLSQHDRGVLTLVLRTTGNPAQWQSMVSQCVRQLDPDLPIKHLRSMEQQMAESPMALMPMRLGVAIASVQGLIALLLASMGLFGLISFAVTLRTREIGIRMAMGAKPLDIIRSVTAQSLKLSVIGLVCGILLALGLTRKLSTLLFGVNTADPLVYAAVMLLILTTTVLACWLPARRAIRINPHDALRSE